MSASASRLQPVDAVPRHEQVLRPNRGIPIIRSDIRKVKTV